MASGTAPLATYDPLKPVQTLTDISAVEFIAGQLNDKTQNQNRAQGAPQVRDLTAAVIDIIRRTVAQGAGTLEVHIVDPEWKLLTRYGNAPAFIDCDDSGLLIPVDVNFPDGTDCWWRLEAAAPSLFDGSSPNLTLTFEDRIVGLMRDKGGPLVARKDETRAQFIHRTVKDIPGLRFVCPALNQPAGSVAGDVTAGQVSALTNPSSNAPKSAKQKGAPPARQNHLKKRGIAKPTRPAGVVGKVTPLEIAILDAPTNVKDR